MKDIRLLSLVIPAYKQEKTIVQDIKNLQKVLLTLPFKHEIIVVVDGEEDKTFANAKSVKGSDLTIVGYKNNEGKGYAVKYGLEKAQGDVIGFIDAGMDINPNSIPSLLKYMQARDADIVIGSKLHPDSHVSYPFIRRVFSWGYREIVRLLFGLNVRDTQAGLKFFKKEVVREIFPKLTIKGFAFDIETLVIAKQMGFNKIYEAPVKLSFKKGTITSFNFFIIIFKMLFDTGIVYIKVNTNYYK